MISVFLCSLIFFQFKSPRLCALDITLYYIENCFPGRSSAGCICHFPHSIHLSFSPFITLHLWNPSVLPALNDWLHTRFCLHFMLSIFLFFALNTPHLKWCRGILLPIDLLNAYAYIRLRQFDWQSPSRGGKFKMFWRGLRFPTRTEVPPSGLHNAVTHTEERHGNVKHHLGQKEMQRPWSTSALTDSLLRYFAFLGSPHTSEAEALPSLVGCESRRLATAALVHMCTAGSQTHSHGPLEKKKKKHNQLSTERAELTTSCFSSLLHSRQHACTVRTSSQSVWVHFRWFFFCFFSHAATSLRLGFTATSAARENSWNSQLLFIQHLKQIADCALGQLCFPHCVYSLLHERAQSCGNLGGWTGCSSVRGCEPANH